MIPSLPLGVLTQLPSRQCLVDHRAQAVRLPRLAFGLFPVDEESRSSFHAERVAALSILKQTLSNRFTIRVPHETVRIDADLLRVIRKHRHGGVFVFCF